MTTELRDQLQHTLGTAYSLERELGGGGMSRVFVAREHALGRRIVVKILPPELAAAVSLERFRREIQFAASLLHPHIVPLLGAGDAEGLPYYTMPFIDGESLRTRLRRERQLGVDVALQLTGEVAKALDYAHRKGVVHRDIKPENILLHDGHAMVADFGIARAISAASSATPTGAHSALTEMGLVVGTPFYMSPEQGIGDHDLDGRSDTYALGCVLYEMLTGEPPYRGASGRATLAMHYSDPVPSPSARRPEVSPAIDQLIVRALAKDPAARFASAGDFAKAAARALPASGTGEHMRISTPTTVAIERVVAVLPFQNMSADVENEYFSDGITEEIIAQLSKISGLKVISRTSIMRFKKSQQSVREIGRELRVSHLLAGTVRRAGSRVRIVAELILAEADEHVWTETYDTEMSDIFAVQSSVAEQIAERMQAKVTTGERVRIAKRPTDDLEAYNLYLLGRHHYNKITPQDFTKALEYYRAAIARDPAFARAHAAVAEALAYLGMGYWGVRPHDTFPEAYKHATKALELDPTVAEAHEALGLYYEWYDYDWKRGGKALTTAVELNPNAPFPRLVLGMHLAGLGRFEESLIERDLACQLDPSSMSIRGNASWLTYLARRMDEALSEGRKLRLIDPASAYGAFSHGLICAPGGRGERSHRNVPGWRATVRSRITVPHHAGVRICCWRPDLGITGIAG